MDSSSFLFVNQIFFGCIHDVNHPVSGSLCYWHDLTILQTPDDFLIEDASFVIHHPFLKSEKTKNAASFECVNAPNYFLKYFDGNVTIGKIDGSENDKAVATWILEDGILFLFFFSSFF